MHKRGKWKWLLVAILLSTLTLSALLLHPWQWWPSQNASGLEGEVPYAGLTDILGAYYDDALGQVVLVGRRDPGLPALEPDDVVVLQQALDDGAHLVLNIMPRVQLLGLEAMSGDWTAQAELNSLDNQAKLDSLFEDDWSVQYIGEIQDTHVGEVFYEADRFLKSLYMGRDNVTGEGLKRALPFHQDQFALMLKYDTLPPASGSMWYVPEPVPVRVSRDGVAAWLGEVNIQVQIQSWGENSPGVGDLSSLLQGTDYSSIDRSEIGDGQVIMDAFIAQINGNYDQYAAYKPELHQLVQLVKLMSILKWAQDYHLVDDADWAYTYSLASLTTPITTPLVSRVPDLPPAVKKLNLRHFSGGVDFTVSNEYENSSGRLTKIDEVRNECRGRTPCEARGLVAAGVGCGGVEPCYGTQTGTTGRNAIILSDNMDFAQYQQGEPETDYSSEAHHIVLSTDPRATDTRRILQNFGIDINDAANGVYLPRVLHHTGRRFHSDDYTAAVHDLVTQAAATNRREDVVNALQQIASALKPARTVEDAIATIRKMADNGYEP